MRQRRLTTSVVVVLVVLAIVAIAGVTAARASSGHSRSVPAVVQAEPAWQQVNSNGFGDPQSDEVSAVAAFNGYLYAGTRNAAGARIFRAPDGLTWTAVTDPGFGIPHDTAPPAILDLAVFGGRLYASTGGGGNPGQIWRTSNGLNWAPMVIAGFADPDTVDITALAVYDGLIYAGATNLVSGAQIWRSFTGDSNSWTQVAPAEPGTDAAAVTGFAVFDGALYAAVESDAPAQVWRSYGGDWTTVVSDGFGDSLTTLTGGLAEFGGALYVGAGNTADGAQLWRSTDGEIWQQAISPGFGDPNNQQVEAVFVFANNLYVSVANSVTGIEIWRSPDGALWDQINADGFGDGDNSGSNGSNATAEFLSDLYVGTSNVVAGGELWRLPSTSVYGLALSPDDALSGLPGQTVTYTLTITNTGNVADTYSLGVAGNAWPTTLSVPTISLNPGNSSPLKMAVSIPPGALATEADTAAVAATSQGDTTKSATVHLTTSVLPMYGVVLSPDDSASGLPGQTVTYTLMITNTGTVADSFQVDIAGNVWTTALSAPSITLAPGAGGQLRAVVTVPGDALSTDADTAAVTATSQGDATKQGMAHLTTTVLPVYGVALSPGDTLEGLPGETMTHTLTITNTGNVADMFRLAIAGNAWTTVLSIPGMALVPGASGRFDVAVTIPGDAAGDSFDVVTVTAACQDDPEMNDTVTLTTKGIGLAQKIYLPAVIFSKK